MDFASVSSEATKLILDAASKLGALCGTPTSPTLFEFAISNFLSLFNRIVIGWPDFNQGIDHRRLSSVLYSQRLMKLGNLPDLVLNALVFARRYLVMEIQKGIRGARISGVCCVFARSSPTCYYFTVYQKECGCPVSDQSGLVPNHSALMRCCRVGWVVMLVGARTSPSFWSRIGNHQREKYAMALALSRLLNVMRMHRLIYLYSDHRPLTGSFVKVLASGNAEVKVLQPYV